MPCSPISAKLPDGPSGLPIPGFGLPFALKTPDLSQYLDGFPEDLLALLDKLQLLIPPGAFKPQLSLNFGKDVFDAIMKLLDMFMPFLMLYKFFLPVLNLIICIIEVLCAFPEPFKITRALTRLFRVCLPPFLNLFPFLAFIIMIISLILLLIALIEYIINEIIKLILLIIKNITMLVEAFDQADSKGVLIIINKIGAVLCIFQNIFVLLSVFVAIIQIIKDMIALASALPPCDDNQSDEDGCCTKDVCPSIIRDNGYTRFTGTLQYYNAVYSSIPIPVPNSPLIVDNVTSLREESWQLYDFNQEIAQRFINIVDGYDVPINPETGSKPVFFPTDVTYSASTSPKQAAYKVDLRLFYNPSNWGRFKPIDGYARYIRFKNCIVQFAPKASIKNYNNTELPITNGSFILTGGLGYEDDGTTLLKGYSSNGIDIVDDVGSINKFLHRADVRELSPTLEPNDGYAFLNVEYTFKPNTQVLLNKNLITAGCMPIFSLNKNAINTLFTGDAGIKKAQIQNLINGPTFPDPGKTQEALSAAITAFTTNVTVQGANEMQKAMEVALQKLKDDSIASLKDLIGIGIDPCKSDFALNPKVQFTSKPIKVAVNIKESNGLPLTSGLPLEVANNLATRIKAFPTFGSVSQFVYDGYQSFIADLTSSGTGEGTMKIGFDNQLFCTNNIPDNIDILPTRDIQQIDYKFVYTPSGVTFPTVPTAEGDTSDGTQPRRDAFDVSMGNNESKDSS